MEVILPITIKCKMALKTSHYFDSVMQGKPRDSVRAIRTATEGLEDFGSGGSMQVWKFLLRDSWCASCSSKVLIDTKLKKRTRLAPRSLVPVA